MTDKFTVNAVVVFLGSGMMLGLAGLIWLVSRGHGDPAALAVVAGPTGTALGALGTLLARTSSNPEDGVRITNPPSEPVPTVESHAGG